LAADISDSGPIVSGIAGRYASALFELASDAKQIPAVRADLASFGAMIAGSADLQRLVKSPAYSAGEQTSAVTALLAKAKIGGLAANFIKLVASKRRLFAVEGMIAAYGALADARAGVVKAEVTVAQPLSDKNRKAVAEALNAVTGKKVSVAEKVDPAIIGGIVVKLGSRMVDSSVRTKLNSLKVAMKEAV
jgi:F-type H+-transporting ATPase subunit delta